MESNHLGWVREVPGSTSELHPPPTAAGLYCDGRSSPWEHRMTEEVAHCYHCGKECRPPDQRARDESLALFGEQPPEELVIVCDDCFNGFGFNELLANHPA